MTNFPYGILAVLLGLMALSAGAYSSQDGTCSDPSLRIKTIVDEGEVTKITLTFRALDYVEVSLYPPGTEKAFYVIDAESGQRYELIGFEGVPAAPGYSSYRPHEVVYMNLIFSKIQASRFNLIEGSHSSREGFWTCMNVKRRW